MSVAFSPDGNSLAASVDHTVKLIDTKKWRPIRTLEGHDAWVKSVAFSPDGMRLATGGKDQSIRLWNLSTGDEIAALYGMGKSGAFLRFPDGRWTATPDVLKNSVYLVKDLKVLDTPPDKHPTYAGAYDTVTLAGARR